MGKKGISAVTGIIISLIVIGVIGVGYYFYNENQKSITANAIAELERQLEEQGKLTAEQERELEELAQVTCKEVQVPYDDIEYYTEQEPYIDKVCNTENLNYALENPQWETSSCQNYQENCIEYFLGFCTETESYCTQRTLSYSVEVRNLDLEEGGNFELKVQFALQSNNEDKMDVFDNKYVYPQSTSKLVATKVLTGNEVGTLADSSPWTSWHSITKIPKKTVCEDVTKYETVTKSRTVTKYKTETICE